jgi:hypothetical protein
MCVYLLRSYHNFIYSILTETKEVSKIADAKQMRCVMEDEICILPKLDKNKVEVAMPIVPSPIADNLLNKG